MLVCFSTSAFAFSAPPKKPIPQKSSSVSVIVDNFEDGSITSDPEWWQFDTIILMHQNNPAKGALALSVEGKASDWYVGGLGTYLAKAEQDFSFYSFLEMDVYGYGADSGMLKIELYEDDNNNWQIEQNPKKGYLPIFDDRFSYELKIDWIGWKQVKIPFSDFVDSNPKSGDNIWNPQKIGDSGGLLQMQLIALATNKTGSVHFLIDNLRFTSP
ncbi:MAG: hypothetical protein HQ564_10545 [Candidatus Saganbacteria bacterium]|nr:hypothetical protein [Candidatus Saganbacteria bacterium]